MVSEVKTIVGSGVSLVTLAFRRIYKKTEEPVRTALVRAWVIFDPDQLDWMICRGSVSGFDLR